MLLIVFGIPITVLIHETGHALGAVLSTKNAVARVYLGYYDDTNKVNMTMGRIHFHIVWGFGGFCWTDRIGMTKIQRFMTVAGGPTLSIILSIILFYFFYYKPFNMYINFMFVGMFWLNLNQVIFTIIPIVYPKWWGPYGGHTSDGYKLIQIFKE
ncbi:MAG TPA: hypothetical protein VK111_03175 [Virgibacillus sp.]|nr:hypothetical protein [Virgibacillus sp.]